MARAEQKKRNAHMEDQASDNSEGGESDADGEAHSSDSDNQAEENEDDLTVRSASCALCGAPHAAYAPPLRRSRGHRTRPEKTSEAQRASLACKGALPCTRAVHCALHGMNMCSGQRVQRRRCLCVQLAARVGGRAHAWLGRGKGVNTQRT